MGTEDNNEEEFKPDIPFSKEEAQALTQGKGLWKQLQEQTDAPMKSLKGLTLEEFRKEIYNFYTEAPVDHSLEALICDKDGVWKPIRESELFHDAMKKEAQKYLNKNENE